MPHKLPLGPERSCWLGRRREEAQRGEWGMWVCGGRAAPGATFASQDCISFHLRAEPAQWLLHFSSFFFFDLLRPVVAQLTPTEGHFNIRK